jgi:transposase
MNGGMAVGEQRVIGDQCRAHAETVACHRASSSPFARSATRQRLALVRDRADGGEIS